MNNILAKIEANFAGVDDALMLDMDGFVSETNATNVFMVCKNQNLHTPLAEACLPGITRGVVMGLARERGLDLYERRISVSEFYTANEVFVTGTMGELVPVVEIDGRQIGRGEPGPVLSQLQEWFGQMTERLGEQVL